MRRFISNLIDKLIGRFVDALVRKVEERLLHPNMLLQNKAQREAADYVTSNMPGALAMWRREDSLRVAYQRAPKDGLVLEFGVGGGGSIRRIADFADRDHRTVHGFDSFQGLPEDWPGRNEERGHYSLQGVPPSLPANVAIHQGMFAESLPTFLASYDERCAFVHLDADLYSSTKFVLDVLSGRIETGTVLLFDEYFNVPSWRDNEFRAFQEFVASNNVAYDYLLWGRQEVAVVIRSIDS